MPDPNSLMFNPEIIHQIAQQYKKPLREMAQIEKELNSRFVEFSIPIRALVLSVISDEPLLLIGPPGTAKSRLIRAFSGMLGLINEDHPEENHKDYFEYLLTPFTEPGELFGFFDIGKLLDPDVRKLVRDKTNMMQEATVVYLDEVFNASSAILNSLLAFLNERFFHDRGTVVKAKNLKVLFAATNDVPSTQELRAVFDRFVLRCWVDNVKAEASDISKLIQAGWKETYAYSSKNRQAEQQEYRKHKLLDELSAMREHIRQLTTEGKLAPQTNPAAYSNLAQLTKAARDNDLSEMSNRRLIKITYVFFLHHAYLFAAGRQEVEELTLQWLISHYFYDSFDPKDDRFRNNLRRESR
jgi:MoxR-like ATPase